MANMKIGGIFNHPTDGPIYVISGSYAGSNGRVSNFWCWNKINEDGTLGEECSGYDNKAGLTEYTHLKAQITIIRKEGVQLANTEIVEGV